MSFKDTTASNKTRRSKLKRCSTGELTAPTATTSLRKPTPDPYRFFSFTINLADQSFRFVLFCKLFLHELFQTCRIIQLYVLRLPAGNFVEFQEFIGCLLQIQKKNKGQFMPLLQSNQLLLVLCNELDHTTGHSQQQIQ